MAPDNELFDVRVRFVPVRTPEGEEFAPALARVFRVELWMAEHLVQHAPIFVKRRVPFEVAGRLCEALERLGAQVEIVEADSSGAGGRARSTPAPEHGFPSAPSLPVRSLPVSSWPPGLPAASPPELVPARPGALPSEWRHPTPPPRPSAQGASRSALSLEPPPLRRSPYPTAPPTARAWTPLPPQRPTRRVGTGTVLLGGAAALALAFVGMTHWLRTVGDAKMLGNTPAEETLGGHHYGLTGPGIDPDRRAKVTLIVAWRDGCLGDDYARFLRDLADAHHGELAVVGAGLAVPATHDPRALGRGPQEPPTAWPPKGCEPGLEILPASQGYVSDFLAPPATYLYDAEGSLIAAWRGGMSPLQRERLTAWLDGKTLDH
jgi:hypothetical protein